jgi:hypothetical protein
MPLTQFLSMILFTICAAGLTIFGAQAIGLPMGLIALAALAAGFTLRAFLWR